MTFLSPIWLLALLPWGAVTVWLLLGRHERVAVPFLELWREATPRRRTKRNLQRPPAWVLCSIVAMLLAIVSAAEPAVTAGHRGGEVTVVVDRGITMSASTGDRPCFVAAAERAADEMAGQRSARRATLIAVPGGEVATVAATDLPRAVARLDVTAAQTAAMLRQVVSEQLRASSRPVIVLSDQRLEINDDRVAQIGPLEAVQNVSIVHVAAREAPAAQAMLTLRNQSGQSAGMLRITSADQRVEQAIDLPPAGQVRDYFVHLAQLGEAMRVDVLVPDDLVVDNVAWLARQASWPRLVPRAGLSEHVLHMLRVYEKNRPAGMGAVNVIIAAEMDQLPREASGVYVFGGGGAAAEEPVHVTPHEITSAIDWPAVLVDAMVAPQQAAADVGWRPLVAGERQVLLAVRESPARQLWIGFDSPRWHDSADFVVFWAAALDWLGRGGERFAWQSVQHLPEGWRIIDSIDADLAGTYLPGLIRREDGSLLALNALDVQLEKEAVPSPDLAALDLPASVARALAAWVILLALIMCVAGVTLVQRWRGMPLSS